MLQLSLTSSSLRVCWGDEGADTSGLLAHSDSMSQLQYNFAYKVKTLRTLLESLTCFSQGKALLLLA